MESAGIHFSKSVSFRHTQPFSFLGKSTGQILPFVVLALSPILFDNLFWFCRYEQCVHSNIILKILLIIKTNKFLFNGYGHYLELVDLINFSIFFIQVEVINSFPFKQWYTHFKLLVDKNLQYKFPLQHFEQDVFVKHKCPR